MAEVYRIEIPVEVQDRTEPGLSRAEKKLTAYEKSLQKTKRQIDRMNRTHLRLTLSAMDRASAVLQRVQARALDLTRRTYRITVGVVDLATRPLRAIWRTATSLQTLIAGFLAGQAVRSAVIDPLALADELTRARIGFQTFLGSAEKARQFMAELQQFGAETPFEMDQLTRLAAQLLPTFNGNTAMVLRTLRAFGDAAALTGASMQDMELALLGFRQIATIGTLSLEELKQVTENLRVPMGPILEELGLAQSQLKEIGQLGIPAARAMEAILRALERPVSRGGFAGGMSALLDTLSGQWSFLRDAVRMNFIARWAQGLESVAVPALKRLNEWFSLNADRVARWGGALEAAGRSLAQWVVRQVEKVGTALKALVSSPEWQNAGSLWERLQLAWDRLIVEPFERWWNGGGREAVIQRAEMVGKAFGGALGGLLAGIFGLATPGQLSIPVRPDWGSLRAMESLQQQNIWVEAGTTAGRAFLEAFLAAFDASQIAQKAWAAFTGNIQHGGQKMGSEVVDALTGRGFEPSKFFGGAMQTAIPLMMAVWLASGAWRFVSGAWRIGRGAVTGGWRGAQTLWRWLGPGRAAAAGASAAQEAAAAAQGGRLAGLLSSLRGGAAGTLAARAGYLGLFAGGIALGDRIGRGIGRAIAGPTPLERARALGLMPEDPDWTWWERVWNWLTMRPELALQREAERRLRAYEQALRATRPPGMGDLRAIDRIEPVSAARPQANITVQVHVSQTVNVQGDGQDVVAAIRQNSRAIVREIADDVADELAPRLLSVVLNRPRLRPGLTPW